MDADRLPSFERYELDLANERLLHDGDVVLLTLDADLPHTVPSRYETEPLTERNAPQYRLEEACSALGVKTLKTLRQIRPAKLKPHGFVVTNLRGEPIRPGAFSELWYDALRKLDPPIPPRGLYHTKHTFCSLTVSSGTSTARQAGEADG